MALGSPTGVLCHLHCNILGVACLQQAGGAGSNEVQLMQGLGSRCQQKAAWHGPAAAPAPVDRCELASVQVAGATRIMDMRQSRSGSHLLLSCQDRSIKLLELTPAVRLLQQPSFTLAQVQQKLAAAKVGTSGVPSGRLHLLVQACMRHTLQQASII